MLEIYSSQELATILNQARQAKSAAGEKGYSIRDLAKRLDLAPSTLQGWLQGAHLPTPALRSSFMRLVQDLDLLTPSEDTEFWQRTLETLSHSKQGWIGCPYQGLSPYNALTESVFYGRDKLLTDLENAIISVQSKRNKLVVVLGASGSGKTSLLSAGLVGKSCESSGRLAKYYPCLLSMGEVIEKQQTLLDSKASNLPANSLLIVDQLEDFTNAHPDQVKVALDILNEVAKTQILVLGVRSDALEVLLQDARFAPALSNPLIVTPPSVLEYGEIISRPALDAGRKIAPELKELLLRQIQESTSEEASVLPQLSNLLLMIWKSTNNSVLTVSDYLLVGGLAGSLEKLADEFYEKLSTQERRQLRSLLLSMVAVGQRQVTRRVIALKDIPQDYLDLLERLSRERLVVIDAATTQISHDTLLSNWGKLKGWIEESRINLGLVRQIQIASQLWVESDNSPEALRPSLYYAWENREIPDEVAFTNQEEQFLAACSHEANRQKEEQKKRIKTLRHRNQVVTVIAAVAGVLLVATIAGFFQASHYQKQAIASKKDAESRQMALISRELGASDTNLAAQFALSGLNIANTREARSALIETTAVPIPERIFGEGGTVRVAGSADGEVIARADSKGIVSLWRGGDIKTKPETFSASKGQLFTLALKEIAGRNLLAVGGQKTASLWDITAKPRRIAEFGAEDVAYSVAITNRYLGFGFLNGKVNLWELDQIDKPKPASSFQLDTPTSVTALAISPDQQQIAYGGQAGKIYLRDLNGQNSKQLAVGEGSALDIKFSPDGEELGVALTSRQVRRWQAKGNNDSLASLDGFYSFVNTLEYDEDKIIVGCSDTTTTIWDRSGRKLTSLPGREIVTAATKVGGRIITGSVDGQLRHWPKSVLPLINEGGYLIDSHTDRKNWVFVSRRLKTPALFKTEKDGLRRMKDPVMPSGLKSATRTEIAEDGQFLVTGTQSGELLTWPLGKDGAGSPIVSKIGDEFLGEIRLSSDHKTAAVAKADELGVYLLNWEGTGWKQYGELPGQHYLMRILGNTGLLATAAEDASVAIFTMDATPKRVGTIKTESLASAFYYDAKRQYLYVGESGGRITINDVKDPGKPRLVAQIRGLQASVNELDITLDEKYLFGISSDKKLWVWSVDSPEKNLYLSVQINQIPYAIADTPAGYLIGGDKGMANLYPHSISEARKQVCKTVGKEITRQEWNAVAPGVQPVSPCGEQDK